MNTRWKKHRIRIPTCLRGFVHVFKGVSLPSIVIGLIWLKSVFVSVTDAQEAQKGVEMLLKKKTNITAYDIKSLDLSPLQFTTTTYL